MAMQDMVAEDSLGKFAVHPMLTFREAAGPHATLLADLLATDRPCGGGRANRGLEGVRMPRRLRRWRTTRTAGQGGGRLRCWDTQGAAPAPPASSCSCRRCHRWCRSRCSSRSRCCCCSTRLLLHPLRRRRRRRCCCCCSPASCSMRSATAAALALLFLLLLLLLLRHANRLRRPSAAECGGQAPTHRLAVHKVDRPMLTQKVLLLPQPPPLAPAPAAAAAAAAGAVGAAGPAGPAGPAAAPAPAAAAALPASCSTRSAAAAAAAAAAPPASCSMRSAAAAALALLFLLPFCQRLMPLLVVLP